MSSLLNVEIKSRCSDPERIEAILIQHKADFKGEDHQKDTYFNTPKGRLKLRQGKFENSLIFYDRVEAKGTKTSHIELVKLFPDQTKDMHGLLKKSYGVWKSVNKVRKIFFIDNVKFHIDSVEKLGSFIEIEAINFEGQSISELEKQCKFFMDIFGVESQDCIDASYSDML